MNDFNTKELLFLAYAKMHFGKYKGFFLSDIPEPYFVWFAQKGFPKSKLGQQMQAVYEIKINGLEHLLKNLRSRYPNPYR